MSEEAVSKPGSGAGLQPKSSNLPFSWGFAPGWYNIAPSALKLKQNHGFLSTKGTALKAPSISAWGGAPGFDHSRK